MNTANMSFKIVRQMGHTSYGNLYEVIWDGQRALFIDFHASLRRSKNFRDSVARSQQQEFQHPNMLQVLAWTEKGMIVEYVEPWRQSPHHSWHSTTHITQLFSIVKAAHKAEIVHRHLHPSMLFVTRTGNLRVAGWAPHAMAEPAGLS